MNLHESKTRNTRRVKANFHLKVSLAVIRYVYAWPSPYPRRFIYIIYSVCSFILILGITLLTEIANLIAVWGDLEKMIAGSPLLMTNIAQAFKIIVLFWYQERIQLLLNFANNDVFTEKDEKCKLITARYTYNGLVDYVARQIIVILALVSWNIVLIRNMISSHSRYLPTESWYPYNVTKSPAFELTFTYQFVFAAFALFYNVAMDTMVTGLIASACCKLELLKYTIMSIGSDIEVGCMTFGGKIQIKPKDDSYEQLKECIDYNNKIFDFAKEIESIFGTEIFVQFLVNCLTICLSIFRTVQLMTASSSAYIGMLMYMSSMVYEIFIYCWHGNELRLQSESVVQAAFFGNWWKSSERYKRALRLIMVRADRPLTITTGNLLTLSLSTFMGILKASYSFFTVLQSSTNKKN